MTDAFIAANGLMVRESNYKTADKINYMLEKKNDDNSPEF